MWKIAGLTQFSVLMQEYPKELVEKVWSGESCGDSVLEDIHSGHSPGQSPPTDAMLSRTARLDDPDRSLPMSTIL